MAPNIQRINILNNTAKIKNKVENAPEQDFKNVLESTQLKISKHANERLKTQGIEVNDEILNKLNKAVLKAKEKGLSNDVLILSNDIAYVINIKNNVLVTTKDKANLKDNIFTNIDGVLMI
ncbi:TIGR02530 family flagellar biosynthesis protein [Caldicellulosiruptoraceae bacterium PP1]